MKYLRRIWIYMALTMPFIALHAQDNVKTQDNIYRVIKTSNGQSLLLCNTPGSIVSTDILFRMGPVYEFDSVSGISLILSRIISSHIEAELKASGRQIRYHSSVDPEQIGFHFESAPADLDYILELAYTRITQPKFDQDGLDEAMTEFRADMDSSDGQATSRTETRIMKLLWGKDYKKLNIYGDHKTYTRIKVEDLKAFHHKYFLPANNTVCVVGAYSDKDILDKLQKAFQDFKSKEFNPELITKVIDFKPVISTLQIIARTAGSNTVTITYQNPGARQDRNNTYAAYILSQLINDKDGRIQRSLKQAGLKNIKAVYTCHNFYGSFTISAEPSGSNYVEAFATLTALMKDITQKNYFKGGELETAQKNIEIEYKDLRANNPTGYMAMVTRFRFSNDENYFAALADSVNDTNIDRMRSYVNDYYADYSGIRCLYTGDTAMKADSSGQQYFPLDASVGDIKFVYDLNKTDIESDQAKQDLARLIQWLKINPDIHVQINGFADEGEYTKAYDDTIKRFIDSTATFHKAMPDAYKKGYLRIELMRAMKIAKAIYEAGITEDRITGTSMVFTSEDKEAAAANRKCTVTLEKIKPHPSLYEYHFGKKKDEDQSIGRGPTLVTPADKP